MLGSLHSAREVNMKISEILELSVKEVSIVIIKAVQFA